jgi:7,8-dihydropterin-6-yl-methyl-4-(beta-D-ribofuranosyl)aminobenzene 5'-phosphate synthase
MKRQLGTVTLLAALFSNAIFGQTTQSAGVRLTNLYDAFGKEIEGTKYDFGFSTIVEYRGKTILFDAGMNANVFEGNARTLKADLTKVDVAIVSHGHNDHTGGLDYLLSVNPDVKIYLPSDFFSLGAPLKFPFTSPEPGAAKTLPKDEQYFRGASEVEAVISNPTGRFSKWNIEYVTAPKEVLPGVTIIPTTAALMGTFVKYPPFSDNPQLIGMPELSVSFATEKGQIIISGCSHSSIESIIQKTKSVRSDRILLVTGGFHLIPYGRDYIEPLAKRMLEDYEVDYVAPAHCSGHLGFIIFREIFGDKYRFFGLGETIVL